MEEPNQHNEATLANAEHRFLTSEQMKVARKEGRTVSGLGIVFEKESVMMMTEEGRLFYEVIHPEAVARAVENPSIWVDYNHKPAQLLGTQYAGTARFSVTDEGVMYDVDVPDTTYANDMLALVDRGDIRGSSFVFIAARNGDKWTPEKRDGLNIYRRDITQIARIISMGPVFGEAYPDTTVAKRSLLEWEAEEARKATSEPPAPPAPTGLSPEALRLIIG